MALWCWLGNLQCALWADAERLSPCHFHASDGFLSSNVVYDVRCETRRAPVQAQNGSTCTRRCADDAATRAMRPSTPRRFRCSWPVLSSMAGSSCPPWSGINSQTTICASPCWRWTAQSTCALAPSLPNSMKWPMATSQAARPGETLNRTLFAATRSLPRSREERPRTMPWTASQSNSQEAR